MSEKKRAIILTLAGTLPFVTGALFIWLDFLPTFLPAGILHILHTYAVVVTVFLCGIHWGLHLKAASTLPLFITSTVITLAMWASLLVAGTAAGLFITLTGFILLWVLDFRMLLQHAIPSWYFGLRSTATGIVVVALVIALLS